MAKQGGLVLEQELNVLCLDLVKIFDMAESGQELMSNQGQALDGYSQLAAYRNIAKKMKELFSQERKK